MKSGWQTKKLVSITSKIGSGATPLGGEEAYKKEGIALIRSLNVYDDGFREDGLARIDDDQATKLANVVVEEGDVLLNITGASVARCCIAPRDLLPARVNQHVSIIRLKEDTIDPRFLHYQLVSPDCKKRLLHTGEKGGSTRQAITKAELQEFSVSYPESLPEQQRIVGILDEAFAGIATAKANAEKNLQNARALFESHLHAVFTHRGPGWVETRLEDAVDADCSLSYGIVQPGEEVADGLPIVRPTDLTSAEITLDGLKRINPELAKGYSRTMLRGGELLLCVRGSTGAISIAAQELKGANVTRGIVPIRFKQSLVSSLFGYYAMISDVVQDQIKAKTYGAALMQINIRDLRNVALPFPPLADQPAITARLDALQTETRRLEALYARKLDALDELKAALLHQAFSGQL